MKIYGLWVVFFCAALHIYGETLFNFNTGWSFYKEKQSESLYYGPQFDLGASFYHRAAPVGFFVDYLIAARSAGDVSDTQAAEKASPVLITEFGIAIGPSFIWRLHPYISALFSVGTFWSVSDATFSYDDDRYYLSDGQYVSLSEINMGLAGDISLLVRIGKWFFFKTGVNGIWTFFKSPTPNETVSDTDASRAISRKRYGNVINPLYTFGVTPYFGIGIGFLF
ncbi:MAG: hypothetical protein LBD24_02425 [Spirochaetaceae bacterium]|jgi:hypothetical protein|nr:hypothetical protein [Spirochaetaceae bacterium]